MNHTFFMVPTVLMTEEGVCRYFNGKPKEIRGYLDMMVLGPKKRMKVGAHRPHQEWFREAFRDEGFCRAWFEKTRLPSRAHLGGQARVSGVWEAVHGATHFVGGAPRVLLNAIRIIKGDRSIKPENGLEMRERSFFPKWVWDSYVAGDTSLGGLLVYCLLVLDQAPMDTREKQESGAMAVWCMSGILGHDALLHEGLKRWPCVKPFLEPVGEARPEFTPPQMMATLLARSVLSIAAESAMTKDGAEEPQTGLWKTHIALDRMSRALGSLVQNDQETVRIGVLGWMRDHLEQREIRLIKAMGESGKWTGWIQQNIKDQLSQAETVVPWSYDQETIQTLGSAMDEVAKRIEDSQENVARCERRLKDLTSVDPVRHAQQIGESANALCEAQSAHAALLTQAKKVLSKAFETCAEEMGQLAIWKRGSNLASQNKQMETPCAEPPREQAQENGQDVAGPSADVQELEEKVSKLQEQLEREREKKRSADLLVMDMQARLEVVSQNREFLKTQEILARMPADYSPTPEAALAVAVMMRPALTALPSAWKSARKLAHFSRGAKLLRMLLLLGGEYAQALERGEPDATARMMFGQDGYKANESDSILSRAECLRERTFEVDGESVLMERHLAIGVKPDTRETLRVHFERVNGRMVIGHCGQHLAIPEKV